MRLPGKKWQRITIWVTALTTIILIALNLLGAETTVIEFGRAKKIGTTQGIDHYRFFGQK